MTGSPDGPGRAFSASAGPPSSRPGPDHASGQRLDGDQTRTEAPPERHPEAPPEPVEGPVEGVPPKLIEGPGEGLVEGQGRSGEDRETFSEKLDHLFKTVIKPDGTEYTYEEVEEGTGKAMTASYIWRLRTGKARNPGYRVIKALSDFFNVEPNYFFRDGTTEESLARSNLAKRLEIAGVEGIALRASEMDEAGKQALLEMIEYIRQLRQSEM